MTFDIKVDITGLPQRARRERLIFVECKLNPITLDDIGQLLIYSKVARPVWVMIISPKGLSTTISQLFQVYRGFDVLDYGSGGVRVASWDVNRNEIVAGTLLPPGVYI